MKISIDRATLIRPLSHAQGVVERRQTHHILGNVLLNAENDLLTMTATDSNLEVVQTMPCKDEIAGSVTLPAGVLHEIVRRLPADSRVQVSPSDDAGRVEISSGRSSFTLPILPAEDFPVLGAEPPTHRFDLDASAARLLLERTRMSMSSEETRFYLNGVYLHATRSEGIPVLRAVATDGHRLARVEMPLPEGAEEMPGIIIPRKAVGEVLRLTDETVDTVAVAVSETRASFGFGDRTLTTKLVDGSFPQYERVIPQNNDRELVVDSRSFADAVDRVAAVASDRNSCTVKLAIDPGELVVSSSSGDSGSGEEVLEVSYGATAMQIGFNARYLLDITGQIHGEGTVFRLADGGAPAILRDRDDESSIYVVMPVRV